jgi:hypothetical protein
MVLGFTQPLTEMSTRSREIMFVGIKRSRRARLTNLPPSVSRLSRQCGILDISEPYGTPRSDTEIALFILLWLQLHWRYIYILPNAARGGRGGGGGLKNRFQQICMLRT